MIKKDGKNKFLSKRSPSNFVVEKGLFKNQAEQPTQIIKQTGKKYTTVVYLVATHL